MRRARRTRAGKNRPQLVSSTVERIKADKVILTMIETGETTKAYGRTINKWINGDRESLIDILIDEDARDITSYAINIVAKQLRTARQ